MNLSRTLVSAAIAAAAFAASPAGANTLTYQGVTFETMALDASLTNSMVYTIDFTGTNLDFSAPHLKVEFLTGLNDVQKTGDLLSQTIPTAVPEPETYALMMAGLGAMGFVARRRKQAK